ncbi:FAD-dependent oxidoreductase [Candidatus Micrarchaeota archaeon]|nr:FAD-dependent oxidoreductase [Candidatus Micrarchaeota archaeon]
MEKKIFTIQSVEKCGGEVKLFILSPEDGKNIQFKAGQFAMLFKLENNEFSKLSRPYSIASTPLDNELRFVIKITGGQLTSYLDTLNPGDKLGVQGPFGHFSYSEEPKVICIAAGTGVAPMLGIAEHIIKSNSQAEFTLFYSNKKEEWIACRAMLEEWQKNPKIKVIHTLTQEQPSEWKHELGRINKEMIKKNADPKDAAVFICGPMQFAKTMKELMQKLGAEEKMIKVEAWG